MAPLKLVEDRELGDAASFSGASPSSGQQSGHRDTPSELVELRAKWAVLCTLQGVIEFDLDGYVLDANDYVLKANGYRLDEIKGRHHSIFVGDARAASDEFKRFWSELKAGRSQTSE